MADVSVEEARPLDILYGWEQRTRYVPISLFTRGQAKARIAWDECEPFTALRCRRVWLHYRAIREDEACDLWLDEWWPGYEAWVGCNATDEGAVAWWEVTWPR